MNKVALITGSSRGIGKATAIEFAKRGYDIVINFCNSKKLAEELENEIKRLYKVKTMCVCADVGVEHDVKTMVEEVIKEFGKIDVLVNNAGICNDMPFENRTVEDIEKTFRTNFIGSVLTTKYIGPIMSKNKYGKIINISSTNADNFYDPISYDYDSSKAALNIFTKNASVQFAPYVNVNAIAGGWFKTDMNKELTPDIIELAAKRIRKNKIGEPEDLAKVIAFLASDDAEYINGAIITVDGGVQ